MPRGTDDFMKVAEEFAAPAPWSTTPGRTPMQETLDRINELGIASQVIDDYFKTFKTYEKHAMAFFMENYPLSTEEDNPNAIFRIGARLSSDLDISEYEDDKIYIPPSYYCAVRCFEKYFNTELDRKGLNPFGNSMKMLRMKMNEQGYENNKLPPFVKKLKELFRITTTNTSTNKNKLNALIFLHKIKNNFYHAILIKSKTMTPELYAHILENIKFQQLTELSHYSTPMKQPKLKQFEQSFYVYDIETSSTQTDKGRKQTPEGLGFLKVYSNKQVKKSDVSTCIGQNCFIQMFEKIVKHEKSNEIKIFAHNGGRFDNIFVKGVKGVNLVEQIKVGGTIKRLVAEYKGKKFIFLDSCAYLQASLKDCCKFFKTPMKDEFDIINKSPEWFRETEEWKNYLIQDVYVLGEIMQKFEGYLNKLGESITTTIGIPGIAWRLLNKTCFGMSRLRVSTCPVTQKFIKESCYGGRVLHYRNYFKAGETKINGKTSAGLISLDGNSLYPSAMYMGNFPIGEHSVLPDISVKDFIRDYLDKERLCIVEVVINSDNSRYPLIPYRTEKGALIYRSGVFRGVYNSVDLSEALNDGMVIEKIERGIYWMNSERIFSNLVENFYKQRAQFKKEGNGMEYVLKIALNSMYGKFLESVDTAYKFDHKQINDGEKVANITHLDNGQCEYEIKYDDVRIEKPNQIASFVLSYARKIMNNLIREVGPENIFYSDTDSIYLPIECVKNVKLSNELCGFKNDYGDGTLIKFAYFLDLKRYYLEFSKEVEGRLFKAKFNGLNFKDENTLKNWYDSKNKETKEATKKLYKWFYDNSGEISDISMCQERWRRLSDSVVISSEEMRFQINPEERYIWPDWFGSGESYPKEFNFKVDYAVPGYASEIISKKPYNYQVSKYGVKSALPLVCEGFKGNYLAIQEGALKPEFKSSYVVNKQNEIYYRVIDTKNKSEKYYAINEYGPCEEVRNIGVCSELVYTAKRGNNIFPTIDDEQKKAIEDALMICLRK